MSKPGKFATLIVSIWARIKKVLTPLISSDEGLTVETTAGDITLCAQDTVRICNNALYILNHEQNGDQYLYFYNGGITGASIRWDSTLNRFVFSHPIDGSISDADTLDGQHGSYYLDRANHTGTQTRSTISDFQHELSGAEHTGNLPESRVTFDTVNGHDHDGVNSKLIDHVGSADDADKLDGQHGSYYLDRANHTGTQTRSTISDFAHKNTHVSGGSDAFTSTDTVECAVLRIKEGGGTILLMGAINDGNLLVRSGTNIIGLDRNSGTGLGDITVTKITFA